MTVDTDKGEKTSDKGKTVTFTPKSGEQGSVTFTVGDVTLDPPSGCTADKAAALVIPLYSAEFKVKDGEINHGFDPPMKGHPAGENIDAVPDDTLEEPVQTSVVSGENASVSKLVTNTSIAAKLCLHVSDGSSNITLVSPKDGVALSGAETEITVTGVAGATSIKQATIDVCNVSDKSSVKVRSLRVIVLPKRTVSFGVYYAIDPASSGTYSTKDGKKVVPNAPTPQEINSMLNECYKQAGITFQLAPDTSTSRADSPDHPLEVPYDVYSGPDVDNNQIERGDGRLQGQEVKTVTDILDSRPGKLKIVIANNSPTKDGTGGYARGTTGRGQPLSIIYATTNYDSGGNASLVATHEVGHALSLGHDSGEFPPESDPTGKGLMKPGVLNGTQQKEPGKWLRNEDWTTTNEYVRTNYQ